MYRVVRAHWPAFLEHAEEAGGLPKFVVREFEAHLECGLLEHGLVHLRCGVCGEEPSSPSRASAEASVRRASRGG